MDFSFFSSRVFDLLFEWGCASILTWITFAVTGALLVAREALTISLHTVSLFAVAAPHLRRVEFIDFVCLDALVAHKIHCILSLLGVGLIIQAITAFARGATQPIVVEAGAVQLQAMGFGAVAGYEGTLRAGWGWGGLRVLIQFKFGWLVGLGRPQMNPIGWGCRWGIEWNGWGMGLLRGGWLGLWQWSWWWYQYTSRVAHAFTFCLAGGGVESPTAAHLDWFRCWMLVDVESLCAYEIHCVTCNSII